MGLIYEHPIVEDVYTGITFANTSSNYGTINGGARFIDDSRNYGVINGDALFLDNAQNYGEQSGVTVYVPPLIAQWVLVKWSSDEPWIARRIVAYPDKNPQLGASLWGPVQACPSPNDGCYDDPETYRPLVKFNYVLESSPGGEEVSGETLYYKPAGTTKWDNLRNWSTAPDRFVQATELPTAAHNVVMTGACLSNDGSAPTVANLTFSNIGQSRVFAVDITVTGVATFTSTAINAATITGNAAFTDYSRNAANGNITGDATFSDGAANLGAVGGMATFTESACNYGGTAGIFSPSEPRTCSGFSVMPLYFVAGATNSWNDLSNWYTDSSFVTPASTLPGPTNDVVITGPCFSAGTVPNVANLTFIASPAGATFTTDIFVAGTATFTGNSINGAKIIGNAVFTQTARNSATIFGDAVFNDSARNYGAVQGTATFTGTACNQGTAAAYAPNPPPAC